MNINKEHSPAWVKITIWITIVAFVFAFIAVGFFQVISSFTNKSSQNTSSTSSTKTSAAAQISTINSKYQTSATSNEALVKKDPKNKKEVASLASLYSTWGMELRQIQNNSEAQMEAAKKFQSAKEYWKQAYDLDPKDKEVAGDYATALYYTNDQQGAIKIAREVVKENPTYATVWFNLGIYLSATDKQGAIEAFQNAVKYEKDATQKKTAQSYIDQLKKQK